MIKLRHLQAKHEEFMEEQRDLKEKRKEKNPNMAAQESDESDIEQIGLLRSDVDLMIWEVDDDTDGHVSNKEFFNMYKRCRNDEHNLEPRKLFNLVSFLMYDKENQGRITEEDTLQILFVRYGRDKLNDEIKVIFGEDSRRNPDEGEKQITYPIYITKVNKRAMKARKEAKDRKKQKYNVLNQKKGQDYM